MKLEYSGLKPTPRDDRDYKLGAITTLPPLSELPETFSLKGYEIRDQKDTDYCTQFMATGMSSFQENVSLSPEWCFAVSKYLSGDPESFGQDIRTALKVHTKHGAIEQADAPYSLATKNDNFLRYIKNWDGPGHTHLELLRKAIKHTKQSYVKVTGKYDAFDNIRATLWKYRSEKRAVGIGLVFTWDTDDHILETMSNTGVAHAMMVVGWKKIKGITYLIVVNSYGKRAGDNGVHYIARNVINHNEAIFGAYMFLDMDPATIKYMSDNGITDRDNWVVQLMKAAISLLKDLLAVKKKST